MEIILSTETMALLALLALFAGFIDSVAGGGGLLTIPGLLLAQLPPVNALATNKLQASSGTLSAALIMILKRKIDLPSMKIPIATCFLGSVIGTICLQFSPPSAINIIVPVMISVVCIYFLVAPNPGKTEKKPRVTRTSWRFFYIPLLGFYDGYLGPGAGMFYTLAQTFLRGREIIAATANAKLLNFVSNIASLAIFIAGGKVVWFLGFLMMFGQIVGGYLGAHVAISCGVKFIRPAIVAVCLIMLANYILMLK